MNSFQLLTFSAKNSILDKWLNSERICVVRFCKDYGLNVIGNFLIFNGDLPESSFYKNP